MNQDVIPGGSPYRRLGFSAALTLGALFVLYIFCFAGILASGPMFVWTDMQGFLSYLKTHDQTLKYLSYAGMLLFCVAWVVLAECVLEHASPARKLPARIGAAFGTLFALASGINYFTQLTAVRLNLQSGATAGLEQFIMGNPASAMASVNMLGWTLLLGLSCLFLAFAFEGPGRAKAARVSLLACAAVCLTASIGYALNSAAVVAVCMYPLLGGAVLAVSVTLCGQFGKEKTTGKM